LGPDPWRGKMPFNPRTRNILLRANRIRLGLGADAVEPEHLLLALVRGDGGVAIRLLTGFGVDPETVRTDVTRAGSDPPRHN
jgi:ATP-dependent Clp protease ATP-binding subunit ClpA